MTYVSLFVLKHVCAHCLGTMAPLPLGPGAQTPCDTCYCNRCGTERTAEEFLERVQQHFEGCDDESDEVHQ